MQLLVINTLGSGCEVGLWSDKARHGYLHNTATKGHDVHLPKCVDEIMKGRDWSIVDKIGVVSGPGSFTSVRVGVAFARGLGLALDKPVIGVTSPEAALPESHYEGRVIVALPAKRRPPDLTWWVQSFEDGQSLNVPEELGQLELKQKMDKDWRLVGQNLHALAEQEGADALNVEITLENAARRILEDRYMQLSNASPMYVREPDAVPMKPIA